MASENKPKDPAAENVERLLSSAASARKTKQAKSPKTATRPTRRQKAPNSFQPASDGLLLRRIANGQDGKAIPGIRHLFNSLIARFNSNDVLTLLAAEMAVVDYARMARGLESEMRHEGLLDYSPSYLSTINRYSNSSRRNLTIASKCCSNSIQSVPKRNHLKKRRS